MMRPMAEVEQGIGLHLCKTQKQPCILSRCRGCNEKSQNFPQSIANTLLRAEARNVTAVLRATITDAGHGGHTSSPTQDRIPSIGLT